MRQVEAAQISLNLSVDDVAMFDRIGVSRDSLEEAHVGRVSDIEARKVYGIELKVVPRADMSGIVFEYWHPVTRQRTSARVRRDNPEQKLDGKLENKYVSAFGDNRHLYFPPGSGELLKDISVPVVFVESEKAALAVTAWGRRRGIRLLVIGTGGCGGWQGKVGIHTTANGEREEDRGPLSDFDLIAWEARLVIICFDSNAATNPMVQRERGKLAKESAGRSAKVNVATVPVREGVNGPDDLIGLHGDESFGKVLSEAETFNYQKHLPRFFVNEKGTWVVEYGKGGAAKLTWLASPLHVEAFTRDDHGSNWGRLLSWADLEGRNHTWAMPMEALGNAEGTEVLRRLLAEGMSLATGRKDRAVLLEYLQTIPHRAVISVSRVGWHAGVFVLPDVTIGTEAERMIYQSPWELEHHYRVSGTVNDWRVNLGRYCPGNSRLVFVVSTAFAGPLLSLTGEESGGFHLRGSSSMGKSIAQLVAGSVWGGGTERGFVETWRATLNGLEASAELHNHGFLCLDELGQVDPRDAGEIAYLLANGAGKARMTKTIGARRKLTWALLFLSSGEISLADHVHQTGKRTRAGQEVRMIDLPADAGAHLGLFENLHGFESGDAFARMLAEKAKRFYGAPIRDFLKFVSERQADIEKAVRQYKAAFLKQYVPHEAVGEVSRAAGRFALVGASGELATEAGITGWLEGEAISAAARLFEEWVSGRTIKAGDEEAAIRQVRAFLEAHGSSRFALLTKSLDGTWESVTDKTINRAGFRVGTEDVAIEYLVLPESFRNEICEGFDFRMVARVLAERGFLVTEDGKNSVRRSLPGFGQVRVYGIKSAIFQD